MGEAESRRCSDVLSFSVNLEHVGDIIDKSLSELLEPLRRYQQTGEVNFEVEDKQGRMDAIAAAFSDAEIDWMDGVTVQYPGWWCNVRPSNTEPVLRLNLEATEASEFEDAKQKVFAILGKPIA